jgi:hypothetical protein
MAEAWVTTNSNIGPFVRLPTSSIRDGIERIFVAAEASGLPCSYLSLRHTQIQRADAPPLERLLVDLGGSDAIADLEETVTIRPRDGSVRVTTTTKTRYRPAFPGVDAVLEILKAEKLETLCDRRQWFASTELLTGDWNYWIDPSNEWPVWSSVLGCDNELTEDGPLGGRGGDGGLPHQVSQAANIAGGTVGLMPFVGVRLKQDLVRLSQGRLRTLDARTEQASVNFILGTLGWTYVLNNRPELRFKLLGENQKVAHEGLIAIGEDELKYGLTLAVPAKADDRRIFGTDLEVLLNGTVVDRAVGAFLRSIRVSIEMKG